MDLDKIVWKRCQDVICSGCRNTWIRVVNGPVKLSWVPCECGVRIPIGESEEDREMRLAFEAAHSED